MWRWCAHMPLKYLAVKKPSMRCSAFSGIMGQSNRLLLVAHVERADKARIISARKATRNERRFYEQGAG
ncbi:hypothetical protein GC175_20350 [bacterium]|nr:hypothetical protein [bacterium]